MVSPSQVSRGLLVASLALSFLLCPSEGRPAMDDVANMAEALKYLEKIDKYYAQVARPRFGRSAPMSRFMEAESALESGPSSIER